MLGIKHGDSVQVESGPRSHSSADVVARTYSGNMLPPSTTPIIPTQELPLGQYVVRKVANVRETKDLSSSKVTAQEPLRQVFTTTTPAQLFRDAIHLCCTIMLLFVVLAHSCAYISACIEKLAGPWHSRQAYQPQSWQHSHSRRSERQSRPSCSRLVFSHRAPKR
jgi:hypothetical protein